MSNTHAGYNFHGPRAMTMEARLARVARQNERRTPCGECGLAILPESAARHRAIHHEP